MSVKWPSSSGALWAAKRSRRADSYKHLTLPLTARVEFSEDAENHKNKEEAVLDRAFSEVVQLQVGNQFFLEVFRKLLTITLHPYQLTCARLHVTLT
ncbi:arginine--tRNA ligase, partial [Enterobacter asburiae]|uniref:arginine--tRNA ligase domain-containing protein n=1 Tax=Enterobacter asburiae TaxID=61645 RepID=UPI003C7472CE